MKVFFTLLFGSLFCFALKAQNFNGQWKGGFVDNSSGFIGLGGDKIDYVLELECRGTEITGYSYTYFSEGSKRYYTICKLTGRLNKAAKEIVITEFERTKYNTPPNFRNCFQTHRLRYVKDEEDIESLDGTWTPAPNQEGDCGFGKTILARRIIKRSIYNIPRNTTTVPKKDPPYRDMNREPNKQKPVVKDQVKKTTTPPVVKNTEIKKETPRSDTQVVVVKPPVVKEKIENNPVKFEKRSNNLMKTVTIEQENFTVDLYDNGEIDGDTVSVFYNGKLLVSHKMLNVKPITLTLNVDKTRLDNELTMYAENLGSIPPNTALMIVTDGTKRYEVRINSDTQKNGTIRFIHNSD